jgi:hypothetical protein
MELSKILEILSFTIPSIITGSIAYAFFLTYTTAETKKSKLLLLHKTKKNSLPIQLQAYERMTLYLERINPSKLLLRVTSINNDKEAYSLSLINTIEQEFEHNLAQQLYLSEKCWSLIITSKNAVIQLIKKSSDNSLLVDAQQLREYILQQLIETPSPTNAALSFIKDEVRNLF